MCSNRLYRRHWAKNWWFLFLDTYDWVFIWKDKIFSSATVQVASKCKEKVNKRLKNILRKKVEQQNKKAVAFMLLFNWIHGMPWYLPKKIQGKDRWESLWHRKAYWMVSFNIARTYLEIMETMMSCVLNIGTITITSNWFTKSKRHARQMAIFQRHINKNPKLVLGSPVFCPFGQFCC